MPLLSKIEYGAPLQYAVRATAPDVRALSVELRDTIKRGHYPLFVVVARHLAARPDTDASVCELFGPDVVLIPAPGSAPKRGNALWVAEGICRALVEAGLAARVNPCLVRTEAVPKSAYARPGERPDARRHYETMSAQPGLEVPEQIVVVDDVVTRGCTLLAAVSRVAEAFPESGVRGFAFTRAISTGDIAVTHAPVRGVICLKSNGATVRRP